jgi:anti-anti-sigma regulatory factor
MKFFNKKKDAIHSRLAHGFRIFDVQEDLTITSDFKELDGYVKTAVDNGEVLIAISFTPESFLHTQVITSLVQYAKLLKSKHGLLCLLQPNAAIMDVLRTIGLTEICDVVASEIELEKHTNN